MSYANFAKRLKLCGLDFKSNIKAELIGRGWKMFLRIRRHQEAMVGTWQFKMRCICWRAIKRRVSHAHPRFFQVVLWRRCHDWDWWKYNGVLSQSKVFLRLSFFLILHGMMSSEHMLRLCRGDQTSPSAILTWQQIECRWACQRHACVNDVSVFYAINSMPMWCDGSLNVKQRYSMASALAKVTQ